CERGINALHDVGVRLAAPILRDGVEKLLAVARRSVRVEHDDAVATGREHLRRPTRTPGVVPCALRPAVYEQQHRKLLAGLPLWRLDDEAVHTVARGAAIPEILGGIQSELRDELVVLVRDLTGALHSGDLSAPNFRWTIGCVTQPHDCEVSRE